MNQNKQDHSVSEENRAKAYASLRETMNDYVRLGENTWNEFRALCSVRSIQKNAALLQIGEVPRSFFFVYKGLFRAFSIGENDAAKEVNKTFFQEGRFPASIAALLTSDESRFCIQALEDSIVVEVDHTRYRRLLQNSEELKLYHIAYLERHWVLEKEPQEISFLEDDAKVRYLRFIEDYPDLLERIPLHHIASRIGITPTQLSRIRKELNENSQHM